MNFSEQLNEYISLLNCSAKELATSSSISSAVISRYRNNDRIPSKDSEQLKKLANGIARLAISQGLFNITYKNVILSFNNTLGKDILNFEQLSKNFNNLVTVLNINMAKLARYLNFDSSYLSRIRNGQRRPSNPDFFIDTVCNYIIKNYNNISDKKILCNLIGCNYDDITNQSTYFSLLKNWFILDSKEDNNYVDNFLKKLDEFDLDEYINLIHFNELKVPTVPFQFHTSKNYYGIEEMKKGELDFFKGTVLSKSTEPVFMCSDMPMEDMSEDVEFGKKWMYAIAMMLKKGLHLDIIHNVERPFKEMMIGLESWIPIYMTGQISPFYLKDVQNDIYCHLNYVSSSFALSGECINGYHSKGKYYLTNTKEEVLYYKEKCKNLFSRATPLMEIYRKDSNNLYNAFIDYNTELSGNRRRILSSLPIFSISNEILLKMLNRYSISQTDKNKILKFVEHEKEIMKTIINNNSFIDEITELTKEEFEKCPISLSLSGMFYENKINYTYEEYLEHLNLTKEYANGNSNYVIQTNNKNVFKNIQIFIHEGKWVVISKDNAPTIHFVIHHSKLCNAIENFVVPIIE